MAGEMAKSPSCMDIGVVLRIAFGIWSWIGVRDTHTAGVLGAFLEGVYFVLCIGDMVLSKCG
jgi:hypothetical protein